MSGPEWVSGFPTPVPHRPTERAWVAAWCREHGRPLSPPTLCAIVAVVAAERAGCAPVTSREVMSVTKRHTGSGLRGILSAARLGFIAYAGNVKGTRMGCYRPTDKGRELVDALVPALEKTA